MRGLTASFTGAHNDSHCSSLGGFSCYLLMSPSPPGLRAGHNPQKSFRISLPFVSRRNNPQSSVGHANMYGEHGGGKINCVRCS